MKPLYVFLILLLAGIAVLSSCTAREKITLNTDGSGYLSLSLALDPALVQYIIDVGEASGKFESAAKAVIFDPAEIRKELLSRPGITIKKINVPEKGKLELELYFRDIKRIFSSDKILSKAQVVNFVPGTTNTLHFHLDRENFTQILGLFPLLQTKEFKTLLPRESESKEDYFDVIDFALDDGAALVKNTVIRFDISVNGTVVSQTGGYRNGNTVSYSLPLERILFPDTPIEFSLQFK
jgi:hypothetical protein